MRISALRIDFCCSTFRATVSASRQAGGARRVGEIERPALRSGSAAVLRLLAPRHNSLHSLRSFRSIKWRESDVDARCARGPEAFRSSPLSIAPPPGTARLPLSHLGLVATRNSGRVVFSFVAHPTRRQQRWARAGGLRRLLRTPSSAGFLAGARSAHQELTRTHCLSGTNAVSAASWVRGQETEHRSGTVAKRRALDLAHPPGTARLPRRAEAGKRRQQTRINVTCRDTH